MFSTTEPPPSKMNSISKIGGRVLSLGLFCYLIAEITYSAVKYHDGRQGYQMAKFDPFLSLDCARVEGVGAQSKERKGSNFAA